MKEGSLVRIGSFSSRIEAGIAGGILESHGIPHAIQSDDVGIFGPGHLGHSVVGVELWVAEEHAREALDLLREAGVID